MVLIIGVRFRKSGKVYYFDPLDLDIKKNDHVIVETARGVEYGTVVLAPKEVEKEKIVQPLKPVMRIATPQDDATSIENEKKEKEAKETKEEITIDDFSKIQLKVGKVIKCEKHPNADKLLVSQIDVGEETPRQIVSGIADVYSPEEFVGNKVIVVTNLKPAKLRGVESQGMVLAGGDKKVLGVVDAGELPVGTTIR